MFLNLMKALKSYSEEREDGFFRKLDVQYPEKVHNLPNDFPFLPERMKIEKI